jgi:hypothetical protein
VGLNVRAAVGLKEGEFVGKLVVLMEGKLMGVNEGDAVGLQE